jgi:Flp pilus assembly protein TadD
MNKRLMIFNFRKAREAYALADSSLAETCCRDLLAIDSLHSGAWNLLGKIAAVSDPVAAVDYFGTAIELSPGNASFRHDLAKLLLDSGEVVGAFRHAIEAFSVEPTNPDYCFGLALAIESMGDRGSALSLYEHGLGLVTPTSSVIAGLGGMLMRDQQFDEALSVLCRAIDLKPLSADACYLYAKCCNHLGLFHEALSSAKQAAEIINNEPLIFCELALSMIGLNDRGGALAWLERALILDSNCSQALQIKAHLEQTNN